MGIETAIHSIIINDTDTAAQIGTRAYLARLPQKPTLPALVFRRVSTDQDMAHDGPVDFSSMRLQIDMYASTYDAVRDTAEAVRLALNGYSGTTEGVKIWAIFFDNEIDDWGDLTGSWRITQDYRGIWRVTT